MQKNNGKEGKLMELKLEEGKEYRTRDGRRVTIGAVSDTDGSDCFGVTDDGFERRWYCNGSYLGDEENDLDIIAEWDAPAEGDAAVVAPSPKQWQTPDGRPIFGDGSPHDIGEHLEAIAAEPFDLPGSVLRQHSCALSCIYTALSVREGV